MIEDILDFKMTKLADAFLTLRTSKEVKAFLRDIATYKELEAMSERLEVAERISKKETYRSIAKETGASTATITRVAHWLHHGKEGYKLVLAQKKKS